MTNPFDAIKDELKDNLNSLADGAFSNILDDVMGGGSSDANDGAGSKGLLSPIVLTKTKLRQLEPYLSGKAYIVFTKYPAFMKELNSDKTKEFFGILESFNIGIDGIGDDTLNLDAIELGANAQTLHVATGIESGTDTITINLPYELSGSPVTRYGATWIKGVVDKYTGLGTYHGLIDSGKFPRWSNEFHTCEFIYIVTDITGREVEYCAYGMNMHLTSVLQAHYNFDISDISHKALSLTFTGQVITGEPNLAKVAKKHLDKIYKNRKRTLAELSDNIFK